MEEGNKKLYIILGLVIGFILIVVVIITIKKRKDAQKAKAQEISGQISAGAMDGTQQNIQASGADTSYDATLDVQTILNASGYVYDDVKAIYKVFTGKTKKQIAQIWAKFKEREGEDLSTWLTKPKKWGGFDPVMDAAEYKQYQFIIAQAK